MNENKNSSLPLDIIENILLRIPAEFLINFKAVCKPWYHLISDDRQFAEAHLAHHKRDFQHVLVSKLCKSCGHKREYDLFSIQENSFQFIQHQLLDTLLGYGLNINFESSCDGLLLFANKNYHSRQLYVCNPATRKCTSLPILRLEFDYSLFEVWVLIHDPFVKKYKVVGILEGSHKCFIFTTNNDGNIEESKWEELVTPYQGKPPLSGGTVISNELHWLAGKSEIIMCSVNVSSKKIKKTEVPFLIVSECKWYKNRIIQVMGSLGITDYVLYRDQFDIWTLQDIEKNLWTKSYNITCAFDLSLHVSFSSYPSSTSTSSCETRILIRHRNQIFVYDLTNMDWKTIKFQVPDNIFLYFDYFAQTTSLVKWE